MNASDGVPGYAMNQERHVWKLWRWPCHKYDVNYMIMQWQYDKSNACHHDKRNGGKLHGNISRNGYGNAIIGRWLFWGRYKEVYVWKSLSYHGVWMHRRSLHQLSRWERAMHGTEEASNDGRVRVRIIHGLNISHKELTYLLQKSTSYQRKVLRACS